MPDLWGSEIRGPLETRLLALERRQDRVDALLSDLRRRALAVSQGIWDAWSEVSFPAEEAETPAPTCTGDFPQICSCIPLVLILHDSYYGACPLTYNPSTKRWVGCKLVSYPATPLCPAAPSTPITYTLVGDNTTPQWTLNVSWAGQADRFGDVCPIPGATCASTMTHTRSASDNVNCSGTTSWSVAGGNQGSIYPNGVNGTLTINLATGQ